MKGPVRGKSQWPQHGFRTKVSISAYLVNLSVEFGAFQAMPQDVYEQTGTGA